MIRYRFTSTILNESRDSQNSIEHYYTTNRHSFIDKLYKNLYKISLLKGHENFKFQNFYLIFTLSHLFPALKIFPHLIHFFSITRYSVMQTRIVFPLSTELTLTAELMHYIYYPHLGRIKVLQYLYRTRVISAICHLCST